MRLSKPTLVADIERYDAELFRSELPKYGGSVPSLSEFDPRYIPWQAKVFNEMQDYDYSDGKVHEVLLSGAVGSAKSIFMANAGVKHCLQYPRAGLGVCRRSMPDLKASIFSIIYQHINPDMVYKKDYTLREAQGYIRFKNGSEITSRSWADRRATKSRSLAFSSMLLEEVTENDDIDKLAIEELILRAGRLPHVPENFILAATNPDSPSHWAYKRWIKSKNPLRHVYFSITSDNPFLPPGYLAKILTDLDPKMARRMAFGEWLDILGETVYHQYGDHNEIELNYQVDTNLPIQFSFDFNIGQGKPLSVIFYQVVDGAFHFFEEVVVFGSRTESALEEAAERGLFGYDTSYFCTGDYAGHHGDTRENISDYQIIESFMQRIRRSDGSPVSFARRTVPNPPVRKRHNKVNAYLRNALGAVRVFVYPKAKTLREGFRLVKLKKGADYIEDDSKHYQHITTAAGYAICYHDVMTKSKKSEIIQL